MCVTDYFISDKLDNNGEFNYREQILRERTHQLRERIKELNCLYTISNILEKKGIPLKKILSHIVEILPAAWQYPEITCARIIVEQEKVQTKNFIETNWKQESDIIVNDACLGKVEVFYREKKPEQYKGPFLKEECKLIAAIAGKLADIILIKRAEKSLIENEERYRILTEKVGDGVVLLQKGAFVFANQQFLSMFEIADLKQVIGKQATEFIPHIFNKNGEKIQWTFEGSSSDVKYFLTSHTSLSGRKLYLEGNPTIISDKGEQACLLTIRNITERMHKHKAIQHEADQLRLENISLKINMHERYRFGNIIGKTKAMQQLYELILKAAGSKANILIYGESGTGKEMVARAIHDHSDRKSKEIMIVNCGAIPRELVESEFFGHIQGAFTSAHRDKNGYLDLASGGTLFLDEIAELSHDMQVKLLRVLESGEYLPVGSNQIKKSDFRLISATNKNLLEQLKMGSIREDFFYRIHVIPITLPPLREHKEDIPLLVDHFLNMYGDEKNKVQIPGRIMDALLDYAWPGNVRELQNVLQRYVTLKHIEFQSQNGFQSTFDLSDQENLNICESVNDFEKALIMKALKKMRWNRSKTAKILGISRRALFSKMIKLGIK
jgi:PAS domain S-box-containing protein